MVRNSVYCDPVYGPWLSLRFGYGAVYDSRLSLRGGSVRFAFNIFRPELRHLPGLQL